MEHSWGAADLLPRAEWCGRRALSTTTLRRPPASVDPAPPSQRLPDVNECVAATHNCSADATCANTQGGFTCTCKSGFTGDGFACNPIGAPPLGLVRAQPLVANKA
jgi:hypothetical protein